VRRPVVCFVCILCFLVYAKQSLFILEEASKLPEGLVQQHCGFVQVGRDVGTSAKCWHQQQFQRDEQHSTIELTMNLNI